jgi:uncharacterized protein YbaR (Trm112 family)
MQAIGTLHKDEEVEDLESWLEEEEVRRRGYRSRWTSRWMMIKRGIPRLMELVMREIEMDESGRR